MPDQVNIEKVGNTPLIEIESIYFKCEYRNPTGSHKDRASVMQTAKLKKQGIKKAVVSSSGNAAISAAYYCKHADIKLTIFISPQINKNKLAILNRFDCEIIQTAKPVSESIKFASETGAYNLMQSRDRTALIGYQSIAYEILEGIIPDAVFLPVSSGTTLVGVGLGFGKKGYKIPLQAVQTDYINTIARQYDRDFKETKEKSLADAIVAKFTPLESEIRQLIEETNGSGWVITNAEMQKGRQWLLTHNINCSYEGAASLAALWKARKKGLVYKTPVCILTGKYYDK